MPSEVNVMSTPVIGTMLHDLEVAAPADATSLMVVLRRVRRGLSCWLDQRLQGPLAQRAVPLAAQWVASLAQAVQSTAPGQLRARLVDAVQQGRALQGMLGEAFAQDDVMRAAVRLLMCLADLETDAAALQAWLDPLTGLPGRRALLQRLRAELGRLRRDGDRCAVAMLDLDRFKPVNDQHGHLVGDRYLAAFAQALNSRLRSCDGAFRYGGDEFLLCLPQATEHQARSVVKRLRRDLAERPLLQSRGQALFAAFSAGVAALDPDKPLGQSLAEADARLYAAKRAAVRAMRAMVSAA